MAFWSRRRVDWRQKHSVHLQLTTAGQNTTPHCRSALSLTAHNLHFPSLLLPVHKRWICCYTWGLAPFTHIWREEIWARWWIGTSQKDPKSDLFACLLPRIRPVPQHDGESNVLGGVLWCEPATNFNTSDRIFPDCSLGYVGVHFALLALTRAAVAARQAFLRRFWRLLQWLCRFILTVQWSHKGLDGEKKSSGSISNFSLEGIHFAILSR